MRRARTTIVLLVLVALSQLGGSCGGGSGGGNRSVRTIESPDPRCAAHSSPFPAGFDFVPGRTDLVWSVDFSPPTLLPFDVAAVPPEISSEFAQSSPFRGESRTWEPVLYPAEHTCRRALPVEPEGSSDRGTPGTPPARSRGRTQ